MAKVGVVRCYSAVPVPWPTPSPPLPPSHEPAAAWIQGGPRCSPRVVACVCPSGRVCVAAPYPTTSVSAPAPQPPRLFQVSDISGAVRVEEVDNFGQEDLIDEDCMLLDTYNQVCCCALP